MKLAVITALMLVSLVNVLWAIVTDDRQQKQLRLLYAILCLLLAMVVLR
jgi:hypothetical protein